eukprot:jgi/Hompol1/5165/HPOL_004216-RA
MCSILVFKRSRSAANVLSVQHVLPIGQSFSLSLARIHQDAENNNPSTPTDAKNEQHQKHVLTLSDGLTPQSPKLRFEVDALDSVYALLVDIKAAISHALEHGIDGQQSHQWCTAYLPIQQNRGSLSGSVPLGRYDSMVLNPFINYENETPNNGGSSMKAAFQAKELRESEPRFSEYTQH